MGKKNIADLFEERVEVVLNAEASEALDALAEKSGLTRDQAFEETLKYFMSLPDDKKLAWLSKTKTQ